MWVPSAILTPYCLADQDHAQRRQTVRAGDANADRHPGGEELEAAGRLFAEQPFRDGTKPKREARIEAFVQSGMRVLPDRDGRFEGARTLFRKPNRAAALVLAVDAISTSPALSNLGDFATASIVRGRCGLPMHRACHRVSARSAPSGRAAPRSVRGLHLFVKEVGDTPRRQPTVPAGASLDRQGIASGASSWELSRCLAIVVCIYIICDTTRASMKAIGAIRYGLPPRPRSPA